MKLSRTAFTLAVALADKVIVRRATLPILECLVLTPVKDGIIQLTATDLDTSLILDLPYEGEPPLKAPVALKAKGLLKLLKTLDGESIILTSNASAVDKITGGTEIVTTAVTIDGIHVPAEGVADFPDIQKPDLSARMTLPGLAGAIEFCLPGMSTDESRMALNAVAIKSGKKEAWVASTDGHRLYRAWIPTGQNLDLLIPRSLLDALFSGPGKKLMRRDEILPPASKSGILAVPLENAAMQLSGALMARASKMTFPNVDAVTPRDETATTTLYLPREGTIKLLTRTLAINAERRQPMVTLVVQCQLGATLPTLKLHVRNEDGSPTLLDAPAVVAGSDVILGINAFYLRAALEAMTSPEVRLHIQAAASPVWFAEGTAKGKKAIPASWQGTLKRGIVIMPMRTNYTGEVVDGMDVEPLPTSATTTA